MKYWNTLTNLEETISSLSEFRNLFELLTNGIDNGVDQDVITSAIYTLSNMINNIDDDANSNFYALWEDIRSSDDSQNQIMTIMNELEDPEAVEDDEEAWERLEEALRNWKNVSSGD
jgi:hypothetical protein